MTDQTVLPPMAPKNDTPPPASAPGADVKRDGAQQPQFQRRDQQGSGNRQFQQQGGGNNRQQQQGGGNRQQDQGQSASQSARSVNGRGGGNTSKFDPKVWLGVLTAKAGGAFKSGNLKKTAVYGGIGIVLVAAVVFGALLYFGAFNGTGAPPPKIEQPPIGSNTGPAPVEPPKLDVYDGWDLSFTVPGTRLEWNLGWSLVWVVLGAINLMFRSEARHRGETWDWVNVSIMLIFALLVMVSAKGIVTIAVDQCLYWFVSECPMGALSINLINDGAMVVWLISGLVVFFGSLVAAFTGKPDMTPWAIGTYSVGLLAKLLLPIGAAQVFASGVMGLGMLIYLAEIAGAPKGRLTAGGLFAAGFGVIIMAMATIVLSLAFGYLSGAAVSMPWVAAWLYNGRFLWGLITGWLAATAVTYMFAPGVAPQLERLGTGSVIVGDSEKIDAVIFLLMVVGMLFAFGWAPLIAAVF